MTHVRLLTLLTMADSWGLVLVLILVFALVFWVFWTVIEYPGLLHLQCVYTEDGADNSELFKNFRMDKLRDSVRGSSDTQRQEDLVDEFFLRVKSADLK